MPACSRKYLKTSPASEVGVFFFFFFLCVNSLALPPTESKHFCLPDKCAREEKNGIVQYTAPHHAHQQQEHLHSLPRGVEEEKTKLSKTHSLQTTKAGYCDKEDVGKYCGYVDIWVRYSWLKICLVPKSSETFEFINPPHSLQEMTFSDCFMYVFVST